MIRGGLCSISFRNLPVEEIVRLVAQSALDGIEWGGDVHVPHGDTALAGQVAKQTADAGCRVTSYGSYYRVGESENDGLAFEAVLDSAQALGAPIIRVWAGRRSPDKADAEYRKLVVDESLRIAELAQKVGVPVAYEYHGNTLTETTESALKMMTDTNHPNLHTYWQPPVAMTHEERIESLTSVLDELYGLHVFTWKTADGQIERCPLADGRDAWMQYLALAKEAGRDMSALLEFVLDDKPEQFLADAATLAEWLAEANG